MVKAHYGAMPIPLHFLMEAVGDQLVLPDSQGHIQIHINKKGLMYEIYPSALISQEAFPWIHGPLLIDMYTGNRCVATILGASDGLIRVDKGYLDQLMADGADAAVFCSAALLTQSAFVFQGGRQLKVVAPDDPNAKVNTRLKNHADIPGNRLWSAYVIGEQGEDLGEQHLFYDASLHQLWRRILDTLYNTVSSNEVCEKEFAIKMWLETLFTVFAARAMQYAE